MGGKVGEKSVNKKNVMNSTHNVTVASPPSSASKGRSASTSDIKQEAASHSRTRTRTIAPEDSMLVQRDLLKAPQVRVKEPVKEPVAFEINFEEAKKQPKKLESQEVADDDYNYESDFESYESDFEAEVPSTSGSSEKLNVSSDELEEENAPAASKERIDSGSFEMASKKSLPPSSANYDSIDDTVNSHDSGISYDDLNPMSKWITSPQVAESFRRGRELMKKITFDEISYNIFETKPIPYETFMSVYGRRNMSQVGTQSESLTTADEVQTDAIAKAEVWTQFPAKFTKTGLEAINSKVYNEEKLGVGDGSTEDSNAKQMDDSEQLSQAIDAINNFSKSEVEIQSKSNSEINSSELRRFVENASLTILNVIDNQSKQKDLTPSRISISRGFTQLKFNEVAALHDTIIKKLYTNSSISNFVVTVHKQHDSRQNLLCLWDVLNTKLPLKIFNSWSDVNCIEIHEHQRNVIVGGCSDGTICLWDAQEFTEWKDDDERASIVKPCEIISLNQSSNDFALDNVAALKSLPHREHKTASSMFSQSQASQVCSLHKNGVIVIWTVSRAQVEATESASKAGLDYRHLKSRISLTKSITINLNSPGKIPEKASVKRKSAFEKTRYYFENDLFSDKVLRELQEIDTNRLVKAKSPLDDDELMKFHDCAISLNEIFAASDLNYILAVSRLNLGDQTRKIFTNHSSYVAPTVIKIHPVNTNVLVIGQANGEVKFIKMYDDDNFQPNNSSKHSRKSNDMSSFTDILSKSCAFQNIVEKEKKLYDETQALNNLESDELKAFLINEALSEQFELHDPIKDKFKVPFDKNIFNSFEISAGSTNAIEFSKTGEFAFVLIGKQLRIFNCWTNAEVEQQEKGNVREVKCVQGSDSSEYLVRKLSLK